MVRLALTLVLTGFLVLNGALEGRTLSALASSGTASQPTLGDQRPNDHGHLGIYASCWDHRQLSLSANPTLVDSATRSLPKAPGFGMFKETGRRPPTQYSLAARIRAPPQLLV